MFKKEKGGKDLNPNDVESIIGPSVKIEGEFNSNGNIMVAGIISGKLATTQNLRIEENAKIDADLEAEKAIIAGEVNGNVVVKKHLEILASAKISGDIKTGSLAIQQGAKINGNCHMQVGENVEPKQKEKKTDSSSQTELLN